MINFIQTPEILFSGNISACKLHIKFALNQLEILKRQMSFQGLNESNRKVSPYDGVHIECISSYGNYKIYIHVDTNVDIVKTYHDKLAPEFIIPEEELEETKASYFVRIKYPDLDNHPYSPPFDEKLMTTYLSNAIYMDRLIIWDLVFDESLSRSRDPFDSSNRVNNFVPGASTLLVDVDIISGVVYYPTGLTLERQQELIEAVTLQLNITPSRQNPTPAGLELIDLARSLFRVGEISDPFESAYFCGLTLIPEIADTSYNQNIFYLDTVFSSITGSEVGSLTPVQMVSDWCPSWGGDLAYYNNTYKFSGFSDVPNNGPYRNEGNPETVTEADVTLGQSNNGNWDYIYFRTSEGGTLNEFSTTPGLPYLSIGTFFTGFASKDEENPENNFKCFFINSYRNYAEEYIVNRWGYVSATTVHGTTSMVETGYWTEVRISEAYDGVITPLEVISASEIVYSAEEQASCSEYPCAFIEPGSFKIMRGGSINPYPELTNPSYLDGSPRPYSVPMEPVGVTRCLDDDSMTPILDLELAKWPGRYYLDYQNTQRDDFHIVSTTNAYFISLSHLHEAKGVQVAYMGYPGNPSGTTLCNGTSKDEKALVNIGYICYIFSPKEIIIQDPDDPNSIVYWDIHDAKRNSSTINPYRCLDIEEYTNMALGQVQLMLDASSVTKQAGGLCAYPMRNHGYGVTDGFIKK